MFPETATGHTMTSSSRSSFQDTRPSYGSQQRYGYGQGHYRQDQYSQRSGPAPGGRYGGGGYGRNDRGGRYQGGDRGGGSNYHRGDNGGSYRQGNQGRNYGVSYGRGGGGRGGYSPHKPDHAPGQQRDQSRGRKDSHNAGDDGFYGLRDYSNSSHDAIPVPNNSATNHGPKYPPTPGHRGRGGRGGPRGRGAPRGQSRGSFRGRGRGGDRGRGRFPSRPRFVPNYDDKEFGCAFKLTNLPSAEFSFKDLRKLLKDNELDRNLTIVSLEEGVGVVKAMETFSTVQEKLTNLVIDEKPVDIEEIDLESLPKPKPPSPRGKSPRGMSPSDKTVKVKMIFHNLPNLPDIELISAALTKVGLEPPKSIEDRADSNTIFFKLKSANDMKAKLRKLKVDKGEVTSINMVKSKFKGIMAILKVHPMAGYLKLDNIPEDCDINKLKEKIKKKLGYQIGIKTIENGKADVFYKPKAATMLERLAGLTIADKEILVSEVDEGEDDMEEETVAAKVQYPKALVGNKLTNLLKNLEPSEIQFKSNSFLIRFNAKPKALKALKEKVENFENTKVAKKEKSTWSEEKEQEERLGKVDDSSEKTPVATHFGSMDIREKQKEKIREENEPESVGK